MKSVFVCGRTYDLYDIARMTDLSIEELNYCTRNELIDIILNN